MADSSDKIEGCAAESAPQQWIKLNVGGKTMLTTSATLCKDPESMLARMFSQQWQASSKDDTGAYMIDADHRYFQVILNFLRLNQLVLEKNLSEEGLLLWAKYFQLQSIVNLLQAPPDQANWELSFADDFSSGVDPNKWDIKNHFKESSIVSDISGQVALVNRGDSNCPPPSYLITKHQFPAPVKIQGTWKLTHRDDSFHAYTRCNGVPNLPVSSNCSEGLEFYAFRRKGTFDVHIRGDLGTSILSQSIDISPDFELTPFQEYRFVITDCITTAKFEMLSLKDKSRFLISVNLSPPTTEVSNNYIVFHNKDRTGAKMTAYLSDIVIEKWVEADVD